MNMMRSLFAQTGKRRVSVAAAASRRRRVRRTLPIRRQAPTPLRQTAVTVKQVRSHSLTTTATRPVTSPYHNNV